MDWGKFMPMQGIGIIGYVVLSVGLMAWMHWGRLRRQTMIVSVGCLLLHIAAAILYGYVHEVWYGKADTFKLFESGLALHAIIRESPIDFIRLIFSYGGGAPPAMGDPEAFAFWQHPTSFTIVKLHALMAFISGGYYYTHATLMGWFAYLGSAHLYNRWIDRIPEAYPTAVLLGLMMFPSVLLYGSGLHKEALVMLAFAIIVAPLLPDGRIDNWRKAGSLLAGIWLLWMVKEFYLWSIIPGGLALAVTQWWNRKPWAPFVASTLLVIIVTLLLHSLVPSLDPVRILAERQQEFMSLKGNTNVSQTPINDVFSLLVAGWQGIINVWLRPWPTEWDNWQLILYGIENYGLLVLWIWTLIRFAGIWSSQPIPLFLLSTILYASLITGMVVPNLGAIARYKSPMELLVIIFILFSTKGYFFSTKR